MGVFAAQATTAEGHDSAAVGQPIGLALTAAKRPSTFNSMSTVSPYDEKSSIQFTLYGMPPVPACLDARGRTRPGEVQKVGRRTCTRRAAYVRRRVCTDGVQPHRLDGGENKSYTATLVEPAAATEAARYITADGDMQATVDRPTQPRVVIELGPAGVHPVTAAIVTGGTYDEIADFDPAISCITNEWDPYPVEAWTCAGGWWPSTSRDGVDRGRSQRAGAEAHGDCQPAPAH